MKVGIIKGLLYYYDEVLWMSFFENLGVKTITNK
jgi:predicted nucleotide-binding protein (sugar kinase/HSP70/actin superfamily)